MAKIWTERYWLKIERPKLLHAMWHRGQGVGLWSKRSRVGSPLEAILFLLSFIWIPRKLKSYVIKNHRPFSHGLFFRRRSIGPLPSCFPDLWEVSNGLILHQETKNYHYFYVYNLFLAFNPFLNNYESVAYSNSILKVANFEWINGTIGTIIRPWQKGRRAADQTLNLVQVLIFDSNC